jgi:hypothetical protein
MCETFLLIHTLVVSCWAQALIIVDQILATARSASTFRAIRKVFAKLHTIFLDSFFETTVARAREVLLVPPCG